MPPIKTRFQKRIKIKNCHNLQFVRCRQANLGHAFKARDLILLCNIINIVSQKSFMTRN